MVYRRRGWSVIRIKGKISAEPWAEYQEDPMSPEEIGRRDWPGVGVVTGAISGIVVLDADTPEACEELKRRGHPVTPMTRTARGVHVYFKHPGGELPTRIGLGDGLDLKGDGGYVVAPPSRHPSGADYEWIISPEEAEPAELLAWVMEQVRLRSRRATTEDLGVVIPNGSRNKALTSVAGTLRRRGLDESAIRAALLGINAAKCKPPLPDAEVEGIARSVARYEPSDNGTSGASRPDDTRPTDRGEPSFNLTDLGNAERLVARHGDDLRYVHPWNKWLVWDKRRWNVDSSGEAERLAVETVRSIYAEAAEAEASQERKAIASHAKSSEARARIDAMLALARSLPGVPVAPEQLDSDRWVINALNGTVDLRTGELREHRREDLATKLVPVEYNPEAQAPRFELFVREVLVDEDVIAFVQRFAGYSLTGSTSERVMAILWGGGKNGKSTMVELFRDVLGDYARNTDTETVLRKKYAGVGNDIAALKGARFVSAAEVEQGRALAESKVKNLTGSDTVTARFLFTEPFDFRPQFKVWLSTNNKPIILGTDDAIWDRLRLIPFTQRFEGAEQDLSLPEKLRVELPGVFAWMVRGCLEWQRSGLGAPEKVVAATERYRAEMDTLAAFIDEACIVQPGVLCLFKDLYAAYHEWCRESHEEAESKRRFADRLTKRGFEGGTGAKGVKIRKGIALRHNGNPDPSGVTDPDPLNGSESPENPSDGGEVGTRVTDATEFGNPRNSHTYAANADEVADVAEGSKTFEVNPLREKGSGKMVTSVTSVTREDSGGAVFALLANPPAWLATQLAHCRANPERLLNPTANAIATELHGSPTRWREIVPILAAHIGGPAAEPPRPRGENSEEMVF